jgi:alpha-tubulin suppressor-like RCC1 family protein
VSGVAASGFQSVTAGEFHSCGLRDDGRAECWGWNSHGELGTDVPIGAVSGPALVRGTTRFDRIVAAVRHTCGIATSGDVHCWGRSADGETGQPANDHTSMPTLVSGATGFTELGTGNAHTCGLAGGRAYCWGAILGNGTTDRTHVPTPVAGSLIFSAIAVGFEHSCGIADGQVWCWGSNRNGQLGRAGVAFGAAPARVVFD